MQNFQYTFKTCKRSFINAFSVCMAVPLSELRRIYHIRRSQLRDRFQENLL